MGVEVEVETSKVSGKGREHSFASGLDHTLANRTPNPEWGVSLIDVHMAVGQESAADDNPAGPLVEHFWTHLM